MTEEKDFSNDVEIQWCPGCPNFGILAAFKKVFAQLGKSPHEICLVSGIGQAAKLPHYLKCNFYNGLHGRALPAATGIHLANPALTTIVVTGEGDCYGEGGNHFIHTLRRNLNITLVVHNNEIYALTKGQASPTTPKGEKRSLQVKGVELNPINMLGIAVLHDCGFVARGFAGDMGQLQNLLIEALNHKGFSILEIVQPCITWGNHPVSWYKERIEKIDEQHDPENKQDALKLLMEPSKTIRTGIFYRAFEKEVFGARFHKAMNDLPLADVPVIETGIIADELEKYR